MNELAETMKRLLDDPSMCPDNSLVDDMYRSWPYFTLPSLLQLERCEHIDDERRRELARRVALNSSDSEALYRLVEPMAADLGDIYPARANVTPSTEAAIDTFIDTYGGGAPGETEIIERLIFNPVADYSQLLAEEEERSLPDDTEAEGDSPDSLINAFILRSRENHGHFPAVADSFGVPEEPPQPATAPEPLRPPVLQDDSLLSESLAKIYIKQRRYSKAFEIISGLSLKYPEKSIYFADQLRFLQKLIINQKYIKQK